MCGIAGFVDFARCVEDPPATLHAMARALAHRGPDDEQVGFDADLRVGLAFRRLAVLDTSPAGRQPMRSAGGRYEIVFNGEVYNHASLRGELAPRGHAFRGGSDTESMLAAFEAWGVEESLPRLTGMFAFAVLDRHERALWLVRDRFGVKPLYAGVSHGRAFGHAEGVLPADSALVFASELKALRAVAAMRLSVDRGALTMYMRHGYVPSPLSIHPEVRKVLPGSALRVDLATRRIEERRWWRSRDLVRNACARPFEGGDAAAVDAVDAALLESVRRRMVADVPLGAFLSGGVDSSAVVAAMQANSTARVRTFTVGFDRREFDEAPFARAVAEHLGTDHTELRVSSKDARAVVPRIAETWDEPFADSSQIPMFLVCGLARRSVAVALSGDGGDELFGGYYRYSWTASIAARMRTLPMPARAGVATLLRTAPRGLVNLLGRALRVDRAGDRTRKLAAILKLDDPWQVYLRLTETLHGADSLVLGGSTPRTALNDPDELVSELELPTRMMQADIASYLVDDILVKVDRASMANSLEAREPLLDHELAELAFRLPLAMKLRGRERKWILRRVLERRVPRALFDRPKAGFAVPLADWLRGPMRDWGESLLAEDRIRAAGYLDPARVRAIWRETLDPASGSDGAAAWNLLMFEAWRDRWGH